MSATEFLKFCISWGHTESCPSGKSSLNVFSFMQLTSAPVSTLTLGVAGYGEFKMLSSLVGLNMVNWLKHIYPWWIWLSDSIFIDVGVIIILGGLNKIGSLFSSFLGLAYLVEISNFMAVFALCILGWTLLSWLVFCFPHLMHFPSIPGGFLD